MLCIAANIFFCLCQYGLSYVTCMNSFRSLQGQYRGFIEDLRWCLVKNLVKHHCFFLLHIPKTKLKFPKVHTSDNEESRIKVFFFTHPLISELNHVSSDPASLSSTSGSLFTRHHLKSSISHLVDGRNEILVAADDHHE